MIRRVVYAVLDLALLALITLAAFLLRAPAIDAAMADIPTDDCDPGCDCLDDYELPIAYDLSPLARAVQIRELDSWWALPAKEPAE